VTAPVLSDASISSGRAHPISPVRRRQHPLDGSRSPAKSRADPRQAAARDHRIIGRNATCLSMFAPIPLAFPRENARLAINMINFINLLILDLTPRPEKAININMINNVIYIWIAVCCRAMQFRGRRSPWRDSKPPGS